MGINTDYGLDLNCLFDIDDNFATVSGRNNLIAALIRRLLTPKGRLLDDPNYGFSIQDYINDDIDSRKISLISSFVDAELKQDERVLISKTTATYNNRVLTLDIQVTDGEGPFRLVLSVDSLNVSLLQVG